MGRILELIPGRDGSIRTAKVKTRSGVLLHPLQRLYPLEVSSLPEAREIKSRTSHKNFEVNSPNSGVGRYTLDKELSRSKSGDEIR